MCQFSSKVWPQMWFICNMLPPTEYPKSSVFMTVLFATCSNDRSIKSFSLNEMILNTAFNQTEDIAQFQFLSFSKFVTASWGLLPKLQYTGKSLEGALLPGCKILFLPSWVNPDQSMLNQLFPNCLQTGRREDSCLTPHQSGGREDSWLNPASFLCRQLRQPCTL